MKLSAVSAVTSSPCILSDGVDDKSSVLAFCAADNQVSLVGLTFSATASSDGLASSDSTRTEPRLRISWRYDSIISERDKKAFSSPILLPDRILCGSRDNCLHCFAIRPTSA